MKIGRNDVCHCGSGKKYKKCCLSKDEEAAQLAADKREAVTMFPQAPMALDLARANARAAELSARSMDQYFEAWAERREEFEAADYEGRIALFHQTLHEPASPLTPTLVTGMDDEMAFEMLNELYLPTVLHGERDRFDALTESLRERDPQVYENNAIYILDWRITNALASERFDLAATLLRTLAPCAHQSFELWTLVLDRMAYYGQLPALTDAIRLSWPAIQDSYNILPHAMAEYRAFGWQLEYLHSFETSGEPQIEDPVFQERLRFYLDEDEKIDLAEQAHWINRLAGRSNRVWTLDDFQIDQSIQQPSAVDSLVSEVADKITHLSVQFIPYLHTETGISYARAELARDEIYTLLARRARKHNSKPSQQGKIASESSTHPLTLHTQSLKSHMMELLDSLLLRSPYRAAALMEAAPAWHRFLGTLALLDAEHGRQIENELGPLAEEIIKRFDEDATDPRLSLTLKQQRAKAKER